MVFGAIVVGATVAAAAPIILSRRYRGQVSTGVKWLGGKADRIPRDLIGEQSHEDGGYDAKHSHGCDGERLL